MLRNFLAVMKDSFREAVDGFIIYVMLGLAALTILFAASISFEADSADEAFGTLTKKFSQVFRNRGTESDEVATKLRVGPIVQYFPLPLSFTASDVQKLDSGKGAAGKYKLRMAVSTTETSTGRRGGQFRQPNAMQDTSSVFPTVVYAWSQVKYPEQFFLIDRSPGGGEGDNPDQPKFEIVPDKADPEEFLSRKKNPDQWTLVSVPKVSPEQLSGLSDEVMEDFIRNQYLVHGDMDNVKVSRRPSKEKGEFLFDVEADVRDGAKGWPHTTKIFFGSVELSKGQPLGGAIFFVQDKLVNVIGASIMLLVAVILTGFFIPNMLRKGSLDLLVAKPMARWELLLYKYLGGLTFMLLVSGITVGGVWLVMALRSGNWNPTFLLTIPILTFTFAILYAVSTLVAVLTRSAIAAILITSLFMAFMGVVAIVKTFTDVAKSITVKEEDKKGTFYTVVDVTNAVLPRYNDILKLNSRAMAEAYMPMADVRTEQRNELTAWPVVVGISLAYIVGFLGFSYLRFATRDP